MSDLYRIYDAADSLLYIGISVSAAERLAQHRGSASWWPEVRTIRLERYLDRAAARQAELIAIRTERPVYNIEGSAHPAWRPDPERHANRMAYLARRPEPRPFQPKKSDWRR